MSVHLYIRRNSNNNNTRIEARTGTLTQNLMIIRDEKKKEMKKENEEEEEKKPGNKTEKKTSGKWQQDKCVFGFILLYFFGCWSRSSQHIAQLLHTCITQIL